MKKNTSMTNAELLFPSYISQNHKEKVQVKRSYDGISFVHLLKHTFPLFCVQLMGKGVVTLMSIQEMHTKEVNIFPGFAIRL